jgi:DNA modification methylase
MRIHQRGHCTFVRDDSLRTPFFEERNLWESIDLILLDPPYNIGQKGKVTKAHGKVLSNREAWGDTFQDEFGDEEYANLIRAFLKRSFSLLKAGGSLFCYIDRKFAGQLTTIAESVGLIYKNMVSFVKVNSVPKLRTTNFGSAFEIGVWLIKPNSGRTPKGNKISQTKPRIFNSFPPIKGCRHEDSSLDIKKYHNACSSNVFFGNIGSKRTGHPCEKYTWQLEPIIKTLSTPSSEGGGLVVDLCAGGFNSGLTSEELGRSYIGFEKNSMFWEKGVSLLCNMIQSLSEGKPWKPSKEDKIQPQTS